MLTIEKKCAIAKMITGTSSDPYMPDLLVRDLFDMAEIYHILATCRLICLFGKQGMNIDTQNILKQIDEIIYNAIPLKKQMEDD